MHTDPIYLLCIVPFFMVSGAIVLASMGHAAHTALRPRPRRKSHVRRSLY